jgi:hypothetical protein
LSAEPRRTQSVTLNVGFGAPMCRVDTTVGLVRSYREPTAPAHRVGAPVRRRTPPPSDRTPSCDAAHPLRRVCGTQSGCAAGNGRCRLRGPGRCALRGQGVPVHRGGRVSRSVGEHLLGGAARAVWPTLIPRGPRSRSVRLGETRTSRRSRRLTAVYGSRRTWRHSPHRPAPSALLRLRKGVPD